MLNKIHIVIADDNQDFTEILQDYLKVQEDLEIVGIANNGVAAVELIKNTEPDVVILDIIMPQLDGLGVLERVNALDMTKKPLFIIASALGLDKITNLAINLGATFYIVKPFDMELLVSRIRQLGSGSFNYKPSDTIPEYHESFQHQPEDSIESKTIKILHDIGIPSHLKGFQYLLEAISMVSKDFSLINSVVKKLYPSIAKKFDTTPINVERAMRNTLDTALSRGAGSNLSVLLGYDIIKENSKVTNSEFIARVASQIRSE